MEENVNEVLDINTETNTEGKIFTEEDNSAENTLKLYATIVLVIGIIASVIFFFMIFLPIEFSYMGIFGAISVLIPTILTWSVIKVFVNISLTLKEINKKINQQITV